eukprot:8525851-Pyramimonas_sp.AAC.1
MKGKAGMGIDRVSPLGFGRLPDEALAELCRLCSAIEECKIWPWQTTMAVGRLLAKRSGGDRVVGLIAMLCRVWSLAREPCARE